MVAITSAIPTKKGERALLELNRLQIKTSDEGILNGVSGANTDGSQNDGAIVSKLAVAVDSTDMTGMKLRGKGKGRVGPLASGGTFGKGKGKGGAKDCKKKDKTEKAKSGAKGGAKGGDKSAKSKGKGKGKGKGGSRIPSEVPSDSPSDDVPSDVPSEIPSDVPSDVPSETPSDVPSDVPSETPTESFEPTAAYCLETEQPSSLKPTDSDSTKTVPDGDGDGDGETESTDDGNSGETDSTRDDEIIDVSSFCQNLDAIYTDEGIYLVNPEGPASSDRVKGGTAAVRDVVDVPVQPSDTAGYTVSITMNVLEVIKAKGIASALDEIVSPPSALHTVGCAGKGRQTALESFEAMTDTGGRRLQDRSSKLVVLRNFVCLEPTDCDANDVCSATCTTDANYIGALTSDEFKTKLLEAFEMYLTMMDNLYNWYPQQDITSENIDINESDTAGTGVDGVITGNQSRAQPGLRAMPFIGAATGLLAVLLLSVLFVRRRNRYDEEVSHLKLDESADDTLYEGDSVENHEYNTRNIHIVGEGDSVISHWTGYTGRGSQNKDNSYEVAYNNGDYRDGIMRGRSGDVHQCSSATCEICAESRQAGVSFIKTGNSIPIRNHSLPSDASREYIAEDTVML